MLRLASQLAFLDELSLSFQVVGFYVVNQSAVSLYVHQSMKLSTDESVNGSG